VDLALAQPVHARNHAVDGDQDVVLRNGDVVDHRQIGGGQLALASNGSGRGNRVNPDRIGGEAFGFVAVGDHLAGLAVEGGRFVTAAEVIRARGLQRHRIDLVRDRVFLERQQLAVEHHDIGVGDSAGHSGDCWIVRERVAVVSE
jgi:hypothetical protein